MPNEILFNLRTTAMGELYATLDFHTFPGNNFSINRRKPAWYYQASPINKKKKPTVFMDFVTDFR